MASSQPIVRQVNWVFVIPQLIVLSLIILIFFLIDNEEPFLFGSLTYLVVSLVLRSCIPKHHRKGIRLFNAEQYEQAIVQFQKSYDFFLKYKWIDTYRYIILLSSSRISYLEMALLNMAYCYGQLGEGTRSKELYERTLEQFPNSKMAKATLKMLDSAKNA